MRIDSGKAGELTWMYEGNAPLDRYKTNSISMKLKGAHLEKKDLGILDLIVNSNWERPIYFNNTSLNSFNLDIRQHVVQEGLTYRLAPVRNPGGGMLVNADVMYENIINRFNYRGLDDPDVYYTEDYRSFVLNHRSAFNSLAQTYLNQGNMERAKEVLLKCIEFMPDEGVPYDIFSVQQISLLLAVGERDIAVDIAEKVGYRADDWLEYATRTNILLNDPYSYQIRVQALSLISRAFRSSGESELAAEYEVIFNKYYNR
jgi:tetratricopeptide (TPR) repeat protein